MSPTSSFLSGQTGGDSSHWKKVFGEPIVTVEDVASEDELPMPPVDVGARMFCDKLLVVRFQEEGFSTDDCGGRMIFSAREEDEHPDIVGSDE